MTTTPLRIAPVPAVAAGRVSGRVIVAQEELFERRRLADETAHAGVTEHADELTQAFAIDLGAQRITLDADVLDALDPPEIARIADHFGPDRGAAQMPHGAQRTTFDGLARPDDRHAFAQRFRFGQDVAGQQHRRAPVTGLRHALLKHVLHQRVQSTAGPVQEQQPGMGRERRDEGDLLAVALRIRAGLLVRVQIEALDQLRAAPLVDAAAHAGQQVDGLSTCQRRPQRHITRNVSDLTMQRNGLGPGITAQQPHATAVGLHQAQQDADRGGLPGAVGAEESVDLPLSHSEIEAVQRLHRAESLGEAPDFDRGGAD